MTPKAVIFDVGNVLIRWNPEAFYDRTIGPDRRRAMFAEVDLHGMNDAVDSGAPWLETVIHWAGRYPEWQAEIRMWHDNWLDMASPRIEGSIHLMRRLRARGVPVFSLTNFGIETFALARQHYDFLSEFDQGFVSGHMGVTKPAARIYELVEQGCGLAPDSLLFTDDRQENIDAAAARGWQTHLFDGPEGWAARLVAEGLLWASEVSA